MGVFKSVKKLATGNESAKDAFTDCEKLYDEIDDYRSSSHWDCPRVVVGGSDVPLGEVTWPARLRRPCGSVRQCIPLSLSVFSASCRLT